MQISCFAVLFQFFVIKIVTAYSVASVRIPPLQPTPAPNINQQLLKSLLSPTYNEAQFPERLEILTSALLHMPLKKNRVYEAELLKQSAIQSLTVAADVCKGPGALPQFTGQAGRLGQVELPVELARQFGVKNVDLPVQFSGQAYLPGEMVLPGKNGLPVGSAPIRQVLGNAPSDYGSRRVVRVQYF